MLPIYPRRSDSLLDPNLFAHPTAEYRGAPFWSWNCKLDRGQLLRQIDILKAMGFGGFHMHVRTGLQTEYLGDEYMEMVRTCVAKAEGMLAWLYDEDRWPSGFAGGLLTKDEEFRAKYIVFTPVPYEQEGGREAKTISETRTMRTGKGRLLARYEVVLRDGRLAHYRRLAMGEMPSQGGREWFAYAETSEPFVWFNGQTYGDLLSKRAVERFIEITYERYRSSAGDEFGRTCPAIFTDEPHMPSRGVLRRADELGDVSLPFTDDLLESYTAAYGQRFEDHLPELLWELPGGAPSQVRYRHFDHLTEQFATAYADTIGGWCGKHGIAFTGHLLAEGELHGQTRVLGESMRHYRAFQLPGIDMLCDWREYNTAKQAQSASHQFGREGLLSELYGLTGWDFDFSGHKAQGDWQAALGVTVRVHHLAWVSMAGEAKRDFPSSISYQSPWWREYPLVEDHFARVNTVLTRGRPLVRIGVLHPVESYWLCYGPLDQTMAERDEREKFFAELTEWLIFGLIDFDFICESLLPGLSPSQEGAHFRVGEMEYEAIIVPNLRTIRATTLDRLESFVAAGGHVIFAGEMPSLVDAQPSSRAADLAQRCERVRMTRPQILAAVEPWREVQVLAAHPLSFRMFAPPTSPFAQSLLHQIRQDGDRRHVFFCNTDRLNPLRNATIKMKGEWSASRLDTFTGAIRQLQSRLEDGWTALDCSFEAAGHLLLTLQPGWRKGGAPYVPKNWTETKRLSEPVPVTLSEPNVLLLDQAEWRIDDEPWQPVEEILRIVNLVRGRFAMPPRHGYIGQPYADTESAQVAATLGLRFKFNSEVAIAGEKLAIEHPETAEIFLDGSQLPSEPDGWWVDEAIRTVPLPAMAPGAHEITLSIPFTRKTDVEWCYLLGDFDVALSGRTAKILAPARILGFCDWSVQGLPFYAGNVTYRCVFETEGGDLAIGVPQFKAPLLSVALNGTPMGKIAFPPHRLELGRVAPGEHTLEITAYGNRFNAFGPLHNVDPDSPGQAPDAWRTKGEHWTYGYQLKTIGIFSAPIIYQTP